MARKRSVVSERARVVGRFRIQISEDGRVVGDSGWRKNQITNKGAELYFCENLVGGANSRRVTHMGIGTGTAPDATHNTTGLNGELASRVTVSTSLVGANSRTIQMTAQFASSVFSTQGSKTIQNLGLMFTSQTNSGTILSGQTYTTSQWNSNQDVNATYQIAFP